MDELVGFCSGQADAVGVIDCTVFVVVFANTFLSCHAVHDI